MTAGAVPATDPTSARAEGLGTDRLGRRRQQFERFARTECAHEPVYVALCQLLAHRPDALAWLDAAEPMQQRPNLLLAALHDRVLAGAGGALAAYFPSAGGERPVDAGVAAALDELLDQQQGALQSAIAHNATQTNEIGRCAVLWPALGEIARIMRRACLALLDFGCSAGLNLGVDGYTYRHGAVSMGAAAGPDVPLVTCHLVDGIPPPSPGDDLHIAFRAGLDLNPVDVRDPAARRWLRACLWPHDLARAQRFDQAAAIVAHHDWPLMRSTEGVDAIERWLDTLPATGDGAALPVVFNSWVLAYFDADALATHVAQMRRLVQRRGVAWLSAEGPGLQLGTPRAPGPGDAAVSAAELANGTLWWLSLPGDGTPQTRLLARSHAHGRWVNWVA